MTSGNHADRELPRPPVLPGTGATPISEIRSIPTTVILKEQIGVFAQPGALPEEALHDLIKQVQALDMDQVRKEMQAQQQ